MVVLRREREELGMRGGGVKPGEMIDARENGG
jgi:hypothetical protein